MTYTTHDGSLSNKFVNLQLQMRVNSLVEAAKERARRRDFLVGFTASPIDFINGLIASQARDLRAAQKPGSEVLAMRRSQFFGGKCVSSSSFP